MPIASGGLGYARLIDVDHGIECSQAFPTIENTVHDIAAADLTESLDSSSILAALEAPFNRPHLPHTVLREKAPQPADPSLRLILESAKSPHASDVLLAIPGPGTTMKDAEFRDALWLRLGLTAAVGHCSCTAGPQADPLGVHRSGCRNSAGLRTRRHDDIVAVIAETATTADPRAFRVAREERLSDAEDSQARPGDVALDLGNGRSLVDVTVASPFATAGQTIRCNAGPPVAAAAGAYERKMAKWRNPLDQNQLDASVISTAFQPLAVTTLGVWDERSLRWLKRFSDVCAISTGAERGSYFASLMIRLSVVLWRGNSRLTRDLANRAEETTCSDEV